MSKERNIFIIVLLITVVVIWKYYWKVQMMYNSSVLSLYTPDSFPVFGIEEHNRLVDLGEDIAKKKRVVITTMVRDVADRIPEIRKKAERMGELFGDYRILVVENDSTDGTRKSLLKWSKDNPRVTILGCGYNVTECKIPKAPKTDGHGVDRARIEKMVRLRNIYLSEIKKSYPDWDYAIMWDMDAIGSTYLDGVAHTIGLLDGTATGMANDVAVVCANGIYRWGAMTLFYDTYATLDKGDTFHINMKTAHDMRSGILDHRHTRGQLPVEVDSCFSGFSIYRIDPLLDEHVYYDMSDDSNLECEHTRLNMKIKGKKIINPSMINLVLLND